MASSPSSQHAKSSSQSRSHSHSRPSSISMPAIDPAFQDAGRTIQGHGSSSSSTHSNDPAAIEVIAARIPGLRDSKDPNRLTPLRAHYLKKQLVKLQVEREVQELSQKDALSTFGPPFRPSPAARSTDLPLARFVFHHFVLTFPFLRSAPANFFSDKVQVFVESFLERNISSTDDRSEETKRRRITHKLESTATLLIAAAVRVGGDVGGEEVVKISEQDRQCMAAAQARVKAALISKPFEQGNGLFDVNLIGVRTRVTKGRLRNRVHEEFIIRTRRTGHPDVFVSRRYGDFARLADTLRAEFPEEDINRPPPKDRTNIDVATPYQRPHDGANLGEPSSRGELDSMRSSLDGSPSLEALNLQGGEAGGGGGGGGGGSGSGSPSGSVGPATGPLAREKNRLTLRAYLKTLLAIPPVADSPAFADFLLGEPTRLSPAEEADARSREALDAIRADEATRFNAEASQRVAVLQQHLAAFKSDLVKRDGLSRVFATIKSTPRMEDLPESYRALLAWARISAASTLFHLFMGSDTSSDLFGQLKRIHGLMPYFMMRQVLRISNPVTMIRSVIDLFLAQPFGQRSLLQRMFSSSLQEEARELQETIAAVKAKIADDTLCEKISLYVQAPIDVQKIYKNDAAEERVDLLTTILRAPEEPRLSRPQIHRVIRASRAYEVYKSTRDQLKNPEDDEGPQDDDAWLYEDLHVLLKLMTRLRDKEQMLSLIFEGVTSELLKDIVTIFYSPLAQVYKAANIADSLYDLQVFITDLIKTVESNEELSYTDPQKTVQVFIDLVARHEAKFYGFVHQVHSKGAGLFDGLMHWIELFLNFVRSGDPTDSSSHDGGEGAGGAAGGAGVQRKGLGEIDLEVCMPAGGTDRAIALFEIDALVVHAYRLKLLRELKLRRRIADQQVKGAGSSASLGVGFGGGGSEEEDSAFMSSVIDNLGMGNAFTGELEDAEADYEFDDDEDEDEDEDDDDDAGGELGGSGSREGGRSTRSASAYESSSGSEDSDSDPDAEVLVPSQAAAAAAAAERAAGLGEEGSSSTRSSGWRPPAPNRGESVLTIKGSVTPQVEKDLPALPPGGENAGEGDAHGGNKRRRRPAKPQPPQLRVIPEMVPLFVEMLRPKLRPARSASATSLGAAIPAAVPAPSGPTHGGGDAAGDGGGGGGTGERDSGPPGGWAGW